MSHLARQAVKTLSNKVVKQQCNYLLDILLCHLTIQRVPRSTAVRGTRHHFVVFYVVTNFVFVILQVAECLLFTHIFMNSGLNNVF